MSSYPNERLLVTTDWLAAHLNNADLRIIDPRGAGRYAEGHIAGAVNLPVARLDDPAAPIRSTLLPAERFEVLAGNLGIHNTDTIVICDDGPGLMAGRTFWALEYFGHEKLAVVNGGIAAWIAEGRPLVTEPATPTPAAYKAVTHAERGATKEDVRARLEQAGTVILDVRSKDEYTGAVAQAFRGGHVPGAKSLEWSEALTPGNLPLFKSAGDLKRQFEGAGVAAGKEVITYCQGGIRAAHSYFVLRLMGFENVRNYSGSWGDWGNDPSFPVEQGS
ncbi:MAG: sulfurtransferase [Dehalococcoidia bacterium]|nr:sulfurtransferase [Dehalococcoidia bacterium]